MRSWSAGESATLLLVNRGFADLLRIGNQARPRLFDLDVKLPSLLYERVAEVPGRVGVDGAEVEPLDEAQARAALREARAAGIEACAIALIHAWKHPAMERQLAALAREEGFAQVSASHAVSPLLRLVPRGDTTVVDAYLSPILRRYVEQVAGELKGVRLYCMQSSGDLAEAGSFQGKDAILSGPAGGIVGAARTAASAGLHRIIGFDMGGTSTDVTLYDGAFERSFETEVAGVRVRAPMMAINTVAAGGGSVLHFDGTRFRVGPDSAGANPGPACYRRGGPLTVTDANVMVGKIQPRQFPSIFGPGGDQRLDAGIVRERFAALAAEVAAATGEPEQDPRAVAEGFLRIAVANMTLAIKQVSIQKGHDPARFALQCFGGAGGQHACLVADELGMGTVFLHPYAGVLSAYGMGLADQGALREQAVELPLDPAALPDLERLAGRLAAEAAAALVAQGAKRESIHVRQHVHLRYEGTEAALPVELGPMDQLVAGFTAAHRARFGFATPERPLVAEAVAVEATAPGEPVTEPTLAAREGAGPEPLDQVLLWTGGQECEAPVLDRADLRAGDRIPGPALVRESVATIVIEPGWTAEVTERGPILLHRTTPRANAAAVGTDRADPVLLELFNNLFMHVAEQTGVVLRNTSLSVNIKERLDFSCAIFDADGNLVANAPHVPVHLGAMGESVKHVLRWRGSSLRPGDAVALNNPYGGGTHLPDVTVITPVFDDATVEGGGREIRFFVGSRGHHADIGGLTPGSTPPGSQSLDEEGVVIDDFLLVEGGRFREQEFRDLLASARYPARSPDVNVADIKAQVAANEAGVQELGRVVGQFGWEQVRAYMGHVMDNAEESVRRVIDRIGDGDFHYIMDDGSPLRVAVRVDRARREAVVDFAGTGPQRGGQLQRAARRHARGRALRFPLPGRRRYPAQRRLPQADRDSRAARHVPVARAGCRRGRGQHRGEPGRVQRPVRRARRGGLFPGNHEQLPVRRCESPVLRDDLRRRRGRAGLLGGERDTNAHDQHAHDRPGGAGTALSRAARGVLHPPRLRRRRALVRRGRFPAADALSRADDRCHCLFPSNRRAVRPRRRRRREGRRAMGRTRRRLPRTAQRHRSRRAPAWRPLRGRHARRRRLRSAFLNAGRPRRPTAFRRPCPARRCGRVAGARYLWTGTSIVRRSSA